MVGSAPFPVPVLEAVWQAVWVRTQAPGVC
jgi:hypothetical protein